MLVLENVLYIYEDFYKSSLLEIMNQITNKHVFSKKIKYSGSFGYFTFIDE